MATLLESKSQFIQALQLCQSLVKDKYQPSIVPCQAIELLCELGQKPLLLLNFLKQYKHEVEEALMLIDDYARSADNWRVKGEDCSLGFGVKDHCTILSFFLNLPSSQFKSFTGNFKSPELICEFLKDWKGLELSSLLLEDSRQLVTE